MHKAEQIDKNLIAPFHQKVNEEAEGLLKYFIIGYFLIGLLLSFFYDSWLLGLVMGGFSLGVFYLSSSIAKGRLVHRFIISFLMWNYPVQFIIQMHGMYEMHFFYFVSLTALLFYENWKVLIPAVIYAISTFLLLFYFQLSGSELVNSLENLSDLTYQNVIIHLGILIIYALICILWAKLQRNQTKEAGINQLNMEKQLGLMDTNIEFANKISQGELKADYDADEADKLGQSLMNMRKSLVDAADRESKEKFVNVGLASIGEILRNHVDNLDVLSDKVIGKLVNYMKANQGGIFILQKDSTTDEEFLELYACRAYDRKKFLEKRVEIGQGLVGQAAIEKHTIYMREFPEDYITITSGLGLATPNSLVIVPLMSNEEVVGCIEMASFEDFSKTDIEFLEKVGESIASTVISAKTSQQTKELLEQSREMTEQMSSQEEEMRQNMEEMQATQEEMDRNQKELVEKEANLNALINNTTDSIITIDKDYTVVIMNDVVKNRYKGTQYEGLGEGSNALDMLGDVKDEWKGYYDRALDGEQLDFSLKSSVAGEDTWREYYINPIKDNNSDIIGASIFSRDISEKKRLEVEMKEKGFVLNAMVDNTDSTYFAMDKGFRIIFANKTLVNRFKSNGIELKNGMNILDVLSGPALAMWKGRYEKTLAGEELKFVEDRPVGDQVLKIITECFPIKNEEDDIIGAAVISKDITEEFRAKEKVEELSAELTNLRG